MANVDAAFGLRPVRHKSGAPYCGSGNPYAVLASYDTDLFIGDPVRIQTTANTAPIGTYAAGQLQTIELATAGDGNPIDGVIVGFLPLSGFDSTVYGDAATNRIALVEDDPDIIFEIQADSTRAVAASDIGLNANLISGSGSTYTGVSGWELDSTATTGMATTATFQLRVLNLTRRPGNTIGLTHAVFDVLINNHGRAHGTAGV